MKSSWRRRHVIVACTALVTALALASCSSGSKNAANTTPTSSVKAIVKCPACACHSSARPSSRGRGA